MSYNYINENSILGMMNKNSIRDTELSPYAFYTVKNKSKVKVCKYRLPEEKEKEFQKINYMYLDKFPNIKGCFKMQQVISYLPLSFFNDKPHGKQFREIRETINKYDGQVAVQNLSNDNLQDVLDMIEQWRYDDSGGMKYGMREHAGVDKNLVKRYVSDETLQKSLICLVFYYKGECVGYSCIERHHNLFQSSSRGAVKYLTRKVLNTTCRNLTEYIDWVTFFQHYLENREIYEGFPENEKDQVFLVNWGCSTGGVLWYKTHKWPVYQLIDKWFANINYKK